MPPQIEREIPVDDNAPPPSDEWKHYVKREFETRQLARIAALHEKIQFPLISETYNAEDVIFM